MEHGYSYFNGTVFITIYGSVVVHGGSSDPITVRTSRGGERLVGFFILARVLTVLLCRCYLIYGVNPPAAYYFSIFSHYSLLSGDSTDYRHGYWVRGVYCGELYWFVLIGSVRHVRDTVRETITVSAADGLYGGF